jgi:isopenicillin N synthase-like dioxygenase
MTINIPSIDITVGLDSPEVIRQLDDACIDWGFFQITGHNVDPSLKQNVFRAMATFFNMPKTSKRQLSRTEKNFWGYYDQELTKNKVDAKEIYDIDANLSHHTHEKSEDSVPWPDALPDFQPLITAWLGEMESLSLSLLHALCMALDESDNALDTYFIDDHTSFLRLNYYPPENERDMQSKTSTENLGIHPHTDAGALTVLAHDDVPGLQVGKDGDWYTVRPDQDSFIINIGDMIQVWSNDRYQAPEHRVLASTDSARYSAPYFYNPSYDTICTPLVTNDALKKYKPVSWKEFRNGRAAGDYANVGEEIQIDWYRI